MRPLILIALVLSACSTPQPTVSTKAVPKPKSYSCDFALKVAPQILAAPPELQQFSVDYESLRYQNAAARGEPDPHCIP